MLQFTGSQRVRHNLMTEQQQKNLFSNFINYFLGLQLLDANITTTPTPFPLLLPAMTTKNVSSQSQMSPFGAKLPQLKTTALRDNFPGYILWNKVIAT